MLSTFDASSNIMLSCSNAHTCISPGICSHSSSVPGSISMVIPWGWGALWDETKVEQPIHLWDSLSYSIERTGAKKGNPQVNRLKVGGG